MSDLIGLLEAGEQKRKKCKFFEKKLSVFVFAVGSAIASAFYAIFFRKYVGSLEQSGSFVILILGMIGVWHVLVIWTTIRNQTVVSQQCAYFILLFLCSFGQCA